MRSATYTNEVHSIVFLLSILLVVLGAAVYAFGHIMPGTHKGQFQGYGMGMVIGGMVGTFIAVVVPYIVRIIAGGALPVAHRASPALYEFTARLSVP